MSKVYDRGDSILIRTEVKKWVTLLQYDREDPDSITITIKKGTTTKVNEAPMNKDGTNVGYYYYIWQSLITDDIGTYDIIITTTIGSYSEKTKGTIELQ